MSCRPDAETVDPRFAARISGMGCGLENDRRADVDLGRIQDWRAVFSFHVSWIDWRFDVAVFVGWALLADE